MSVIGMDVGTSSTKGLLVDGDLHALGQGRIDYKLRFPAQGRVEQDPAVVVRAVHLILGRLARDAVDRRDPVTALALSVSGDEAAPVDCSGKVLYPCIIAMDTRSQETALEFGRRVGEDEIYRRTGLPLHGMYPLVRLVWLRENEPEVFSQTVHMWCWQELVHASLGVTPAIDHSLASRTMAFNIASKAWDERLLGAAGLPASIFPRSVPSGVVVGRVAKRAVAGWGGVDLPLVVSGGFDQPMAALGAGIVSPGGAGVCTGSWEAVTVVTEEPVLTPVARRSGYSFGCFIRDGLYFCQASNSGGGAVLAWYRDTFGQDAVRRAHRSKRDSFSEILEEATADPVDLIFVPHLEGAYNPGMEPLATGTVAGLRLSTTRGDVIKALIQGVTFELRENIEGLETLGLTVPSLRASGGGAQSEQWLQLKADVTGRSVAALSAWDTGPLAAACLAAVGTGIYASVDEAMAQAVHVVRVYEPRAALQSQFDELYEKHRSVERELIARAREAGRSTARSRAV